MKDFFEIKSRMDYENLMSYASAMGFRWRSGGVPFEVLPPTSYPYFIVVEHGRIRYSDNVPPVEMTTIPTKEYL